jgi:hypothetical protein
MVSVGLVKCLYALFKKEYIALSKLLQEIWVEFISVGYSSKTWKYTAMSVCVCVCVCVCVIVIINCSLRAVSITQTTDAHHPDTRHWRWHWYDICDIFRQYKYGATFLPTPFVGYQPIPVTMRVFVCLLSALALCQGNHFTTTLGLQFTMATGHYCQRVHTSTATHQINVCLTEKLCGYEMCAHVTLTWSCLQCHLNIMAVARVMSLAVSCALLVDINTR